MKLVLGTMTFGDQVGQQDAQTLMTLFRDAGHRELDTAHVYTGGRAEEMLGRMLSPADHDGVYIASKVNPWNDGGLQPAEVRRQFDETLQRLGRDRPVRVRTTGPQRP